MPWSVKIGLSIPGFGGIEGTWSPDEREREAAWEMYVELVTRVSVVELKHDQGLVREAISSLYTLFETTRSILREKGPSVAMPKDDGNLSFGVLAVAMLNVLIRPFLARWHPLLLDHESRRPASVSVMEHERAWDRHDEVRGELALVREALREYARILAEVAQVPPLTTARPQS